MNKQEAFQDNKVKVFQLHPIAVGEEFRALVMDAYPALLHHEKASAYRGIMQYLLFSTFLDEKAMDEERIVFPFTHVAGCVGLYPKAAGFSAADELADFCRDVAPLNIKESRFTDKQARSVSLILPPHVQNALAKERERMTDKNLVWFQSGISVSRRNRRDYYQAFQKYQEEMAQLPPDHPAFELGELMRTQPQDVFSRVLNNNLPYVKQSLLDSPCSSDQEKATRGWNLRVLHSVGDYVRQFYTSVGGSWRLFSQAPSINHLSRDFRRMALAGEMEFDLRACQLAVVAKLWNVPLLQRLLENEKSIWQFFSDLLGKPIERCKPILKTAIYAIVFGMRAREVCRMVAYGTRHDLGIGQTAALKFINHPIVESLLEARTRELVKIAEQDGAEDAFGYWWRVQRNNRNQQTVRGRRSVLAAVVQSYEMQLMLSILPFLQNGKQIRLLSWLHDGVTLRMSDPTHRSYQIREMQAAVARTAAMLGMATELEAKQLPQISIYRH